MNLAGIVLAAGASSRMGTPKALLSYQGESFISRLCRLLRPWCQPVILVWGHAEVTLELPGVILVRNPDPELGQLSSLQCGLRALDPTQSVLYTPVDHAALRPETLAKLVTAFETQPYPVVQPRYQGRRGHPVLVRPAIAAQLLRLPPSATARHAVHAPGVAIGYVDVPDPAVVHDVDTPADYQALLTGGEP